MGRGLPKKYAKMGFKKGWREYKKTKRKTSTKRRTYTKPRKTRRKRRRIVSKKKKQNKGSGGMKFHIAAMAGALVPTVVDLWDNRSDPGGAALEVVAGWTGYRPGEDMDFTKMGTYWGSLLAGVIGSKIAAKLGVNKYLPKGINI